MNRQKWQSTRAILGRRAIDLGHAYGRACTRRDDMGDEDPEYANAEEQAYILGQAHADISRVLDDWDELDGIMGEVFSEKLKAGA